MTLQIWLLSDGQPGHDSLSHGIVAALQRRQPVEVQLVALHLRFGLARNLMRFMLNRGVFPPAAFLRLFYSMGALPDGRCDLIVSAGGKTSFASAWLAQSLQVPNVFYGSLRRLSASLFTQVLTVEPLDPAAANNLVLSIPPSAIDASEVPAQGAELRQQLALGGEPLWLMLLGGNGAGYSYLKDDWTQLARAMASLSERHGVRWLLLASRRTGDDVRRIMSEKLPLTMLAAVDWGREIDAMTVAACLGAAERTFVTEDSMTMISEAIHAGSPVTTLQPGRIDSTPRYEAMLTAFAEHFGIQRKRIVTLGKMSEWPERTAPESLHDELANRLYEKLPIC